MAKGMAGTRAATHPSCPTTLLTAIGGANKKKKRGTTLPWFQGGRPSMARGNKFTTKSPVCEAGAEAIQPLQGTQGDLPCCLPPRAPPSLDPS